MDNFLPVNRGIRKHWVYKDSEYYHAWSEMLFLARYSEEKETVLVDGESVEVGFGEFIFGRKSWSANLKISEQRLRTFIKRLIDDNMISLVKNYRKSTVYKLTNYANYNGSANHQSNHQTNHQINHLNNHQSNHQKTLIDQGLEGDANHHSNHLNNHQINREPTTKLTTLNKDIKKDKEKECKHVFDFWNSKGIKKHREFPDAMKGHVSARLSVHGVQAVLNAIDAYSSIISDPETYWYSHKFTLTEFMNPKNLDRFLEENDPLGSHKRTPIQSIPKSNTGYSPGYKKLEPDEAERARMEKMYKLDDERRKNASTRTS